MREVEEDEVQPYFLGLLVDLSAGAEESEAVGGGCHGGGVDAVGEGFAGCEGCGG